MYVKIFWKIYACREMVVTLRLWDPRRMAPVIGRPARWWRVHQDLSSCSKPRFQVGYSRGRMWQHWKNEGKTINGTVLLIPHMSSGWRRFEDVWQPMFKNVYPYKNHLAVVQVSELIKCSAKFYLILFQGSYQYIQYICQVLKG